MILMIDEEKSKMRSFKDYLNEYGYDVYMSTNFVDSSEFINENKNNIDLIFLDIMMPYLNYFTNEETINGLISGECFYNKIQKELKYTIPVIILTAINNKELLTRLSKNNNTIVHQKTDSPSDILASVKKLINR